MITIYFAQKNYDAVLSKDEDKPFFDDIITAHDDLEVLKAAVSKYKISDEDKCYELQDTE